AHPRLPHWAIQTAGAPSSLSTAAVPAGLRLPRRRRRLGRAAPRAAPAAGGRAMRRAGRRPPRRRRRSCAATRASRPGATRTAGTRAGDAEFTFQRCCGCREALLEAAAALAAARGGGLSCWNEDVHSSPCCDLRLGRTGDARCWAGEYTYDACCRLRHTPSDGASACELAFRACPACISLLGVPWFRRDHWRDCHRAGGLVWVSECGLDAPVAMCVPKGASCWPMSGEGQVESLLDALEHQTYIPRIDITHCTPSWDPLHGPILVALGLPFVFILLGGSRRLADVCASHWKPGRHCAVDALRILGTLTGVVRHLNFRRFADGNPNVGSKGFCYSEAINDVSGRFLDTFTVASVLLLVRSPPRSAAEWSDKLWAKLARQWPLMVVPWELLGTACTHASSCLEQWPYGEVVKRRSFWQRLLFEDCIWYLRVDLWTNMACSALLVLHHRTGSRCFWLAWAVLAGACLRQASHNTPRHYKLWSCRLPLALLVLGVTQSRSAVRAWCRLPRCAAWAAIGSLVVLGWGFCSRSWSLFKDECATTPKQGWLYLLEGACFHVGLAAACLRGGGDDAKVGNQSIGWLLNWLAGLSLGVVLVNGEDALYTSMVNCERGQVPPWAFLERDGSFTEFNSAQLMERPRWIGFVLRVALGVLMLVVSQLAVWIVQRPWVALLRQLPRALTRAVVAAFLAVQLWRNGPSLGRSGGGSDDA
ncbi:unnamed protein product, partial [Prorocentrum cordatum]